MNQSFKKEKLDSILLNFAEKVIQNKFTYR